MSLVSSRQNVFQESNVLNTSTDTLKFFLLIFPIYKNFSTTVKSINQNWKWKFLNNWKLKKTQKNKVNAIG